MREAVTKQPRRRTLAVAMLMLATTAGATVAGIAAASAAEPPHFVAVGIPTQADPGVGGHGIAPTSGQAQQLALNGISNLCKQAGYLDVAPGFRTNGLAASSGQSTTPDGNVLFTAFGVCAEGGSNPDQGGPEEQDPQEGAQAADSTSSREDEPLFRAR